MSSEIVVQKESAAEAAAAAVVECYSAAVVVVVAAVVVTEPFLTKQTKSLRFIALCGMPKTKSKFSNGREQVLEKEKRYLD